MANLDNKSDVIVLITSGFPFDNHENYLETEVLYLSEKFSKVIIISHNTDSKNPRDVPRNIEINRLRYNLNFFEKIVSVRQIISLDFWKEIKIIINQYKINLSVGILKTLLVSLENANRLKKTYRECINQIQEERVVVYSYWCNDSAIALAKIKYKGYYNTKFISRMHRWDIYFEESKYGYLPLRKKIFSQLDDVISVSEDGIKYLNHKLNFNTSKFKVSRLGVRKIGDIKYRSRAELLIVSCSNLIAVKRVHLIAESLALIQDCKIRWTHFGDGIKKREIIEYCNRNFSKNITVEFKGRVLNKEVLDFYIKNSPDLLINLSSSEGIPLSIMEAMSCSIPVIATNVGGTSEIVNDKNGLLIEMGVDVDEVSKFIKKLYNLNNKEKETFRNNAYETWRRLYNADENYNKFIEEIKFNPQKNN